MLSARARRSPRGCGGLRRDTPRPRGSDAGAACCAPPSRTPTLELREPLAHRRGRDVELSRRGGQAAALGQCRKKCRSSPRSAMGSYLPESRACHSRRPVPCWNEWFSRVLIYSPVEPASSRTSTPTRSTPANGEPGSGLRTLTDTMARVSPPYIGQAPAQGHHPQVLADAWRDSPATSASACRRTCRQAGGVARQRDKPLAEAVYLRCCRTRRPPTSSTARAARTPAPSSTSFTRARNFPLLGELEDILTQRHAQPPRKAPLRHNAVETFVEKNTGDQHRHRDPLARLGDRARRRQRHDRRLHGGRRLHAARRGQGADAGRRAMRAWRSSCST